MYGIDFEKEELDWYTQLNSTQFSVFQIRYPSPPSKVEVFRSQVPLVS